MSPATASSSTWFAQRGKPFWLVLGALAAAQLFAFWLLCNQQVRKAEARHSELQAQQMALADCLQSIGSTLASCRARPAAAQPQAVAVGPTGTTPVSYNFR